MSPGGGLCDGTAQHLQWGASSCSLVRLCSAQEHNKLTMSFYLPSAASPCSLLSIKDELFAAASFNGSNGAYNSAMASQASAAAAAAAMPAALASGSSTGSGASGGTRAPVPLFC